MSLIGCGGGNGGGDGPPPPVVMPSDAFRHGVASGDPLSDAVILWTRVTPPSEGTVDVEWEIAEDPFFEQSAGGGTVTTDASRDYTVKVDATGLRPGRPYYYRFRAMGGSSLVGRTRTAPTSTERFRFAMCSCSRFEDGFYHAYRRIAERNDLDAVVHLGDYIYEYGGGGTAERPVEPAHEILTLEDYRTRYATYRRDRDLQAAHQLHPWIVVWDEHETANNSYIDGAENHNAGEGDYAERKANAYQAYVEWLPIREQEPDKLWRTFRFGELAELIMLDTRRWGRDGPVPDSELADPERQLLGADQESWLREQLGTPAQWKILGQQVMMGQLTFGSESVLNPDQWDGYPAARGRVFDMIESMGLDDVVVLTGDIHTSWAIDLARDPFDESMYDEETGRGALAVEFVTTSITSNPDIPFSERLVASVVRSNPHLKFAELNRRGYVLVDVTPERTAGEWWLIDGIERDQGTQTFAAGWQTRAGENHLVPAFRPSLERVGPVRPGFVPEPMGTGGETGEMMAMETEMAGG
ncbi:MAG: alkaline phosphatase D family protein [Polyangiales bacterium]